MYLASLMLLGSGELGREVAIAAKRLGCRVIACDRYDDAPAMQVSDAREVFAMPARIGVPGQRLRGLADSVESPRMAVPAGLVLYGARQVTTSGGFGTGSRKSPAVEKVLAPVKRWLQDFF